MVIWGSVIDKAQKWLLSVIGIATAAVSIYLYGRNAGALRQAQKAEQKDRDNARKIEDAADSARTHAGDPVERLHKHGRIRD